MEAEDGQAVMRLWLIAIWGLVRRLGLPAVLLLIGLALAPWLGGRLPIGSGALVPEHFLHEAFIARMVPSVGQAVLALLIAIPFIWIVVKRPVLTAPASNITGAVFLFWVWMGFSALASQFPNEAFAEFARWTVYLLMMAGCVMALGRSAGVHAALGAIIVGVSLAALGGISEYLAMRENDPTWRIFGGWHNPNALAAMFALALPVMLSVAILGAYRKGGANGARPFWQSPAGAAIAIFAAALTLAALWLTQSKGGLIACVVGLLALFVMLGVEAHRRNRPAVPVAAAMAAIPFILAAAILFVGYAGGSRVFSAGAEAQQSVGFRAQLWKDSLKMVTDNSFVGVGPGGFDPAFPRYSETEGSVHAHSSYVQLIVESGPLALVLLLAVAFLWFSSLLRRHPAAPASTNVLRAGVIGSVAAGGVSALIESSFIYFGFSVLFFALFGIGLLLSVDGARSERFPLVSRAFGGTVLGLGAIAYLLAFAVADVQTSMALHAIRTGDSKTAMARLSSATHWLPVHSHAYSLRGRLNLESGDAAAALADFRQAAALRPTSSTFARLAGAMARARDVQGAVENYRRAIAFAPANPRWRRELFEFFRNSGNARAAGQVAEELVEMESSTFFSLRALPWLVNTDTVGARRFLAKLAHEEGNTDDEVAHLTAAFEILAGYRRKTYTQVKLWVEKLGGGTEESKDVPLGGETLREAEAKFVSLVDAGEALIRALQEQGDEEKAQGIADTIEELRAL
ncbi:MAG: O-antigen ligase family protein [Armatimonadetes bacterium]|nr:O-antigen ligase family protein [Armatimonadota bacterium]